MVSKASVAPKVIASHAVVSLLLWIPGIYGMVTIPNGSQRTVLLFCLLLATAISMTAGIALARSLGQPLARIRDLAGELAKGHLGTRLDMNRQDEIGMLAGELDALAGNLRNNFVTALERLGKGTVPADLEVKDRQDEITPALVAASLPLRKLVEDLTTLHSRIAKGETGAAIDAAAYAGAYREAVGLVNTIAADCAASLKTANGTIEQLRSSTSDFLSQVNRLTGEHAAGNTEAVIPVERLDGSFKAAAQGINAMAAGDGTTLKKAMACVAEFGRGRFDAPIEKFSGKRAFVNEAIEQLRRSCKELLAQTSAVISAIRIEGTVSARADGSKLQGDFQKVIQSFNDTLDAIVIPYSRSIDFFANLSQGKIPNPITEERKGDFLRMKEAANTCIVAVNRMLEDTLTVANAIIDGHVGVRADAAKHEGDYRKIIEGVNAALDAIVRPVRDADAILAKIAENDLAVRVVGEYKGDLAKVQFHVNAVATNLDKALNQVSEITEQVASASRQISSGSQSLANGANEQASSLEEVSSSLEEMSAMTKQNAEKAGDAKRLADDATSSAKQGETSMGRMSDAINKIKESSDQTAKIVKTIDEIAMQTNLLALNAAVEAARAGEAGRGFAVVAEEVRNLAQRSAQAAKNTADMINESVKNAGDGVMIANEVSKAFGLIATGAKQSNDLVNEIATASREQSQGIEQIAKAVSEMDKITQQNAANSEESASAAEELSSQAEELRRMLSQFKLTAMASKKTAPGAGVAFGAKQRAVAGRPGGNGKTTLAAATRPGRMDAEKFIPLGDEGLREF